MRLAHLLSTAALAVLPVADGAAQTVRGQVLDELSAAPVVDALILIESEDGEAAIRDATDESGGFVFHAVPGAHRFRVISSGYVDLVSPWMDLQTGYVYPVDLMLQPRPVELEAVTVEVAAHEALLEGLGLNATELGRRVIGRELIDQRPTARDVGDILQWQSPPGIRIARLENDAGLGGGGGLNQTIYRMDLCVAFPRGNSFSGARQCAVFALNGAVTTEDAIAMLDPEDIESIVVLTPSEATQIYGTGAYGGAVVVYTRRGRGR